MTRLKQAGISNISLLYFGKMSGILVAFFFLPMYSRLLGAEQFGMVAIVLSLQALLMMLDLGMATLVSREVAAAILSPLGLVRLIRTAEASLSGFYLLLLLAAILFKGFGGLPDISLGTAVATLVLLWLLVLQNLFYSTILAQRDYKAATVIQGIGVIVRALASWWVLVYFSATFSAFIFIQVAISALHCAVSRVYSYKLLYRSVKESYVKVNVTLAECLSLLRNGRALLLSGIAGALAMQLDKPIISFFMTAGELSPYFLAVTLSSAPVGMLAAPIVQYFQPKITNDLATKNLVSYQKNLKNFIALIVLFGLLPTVILYVFNDFIVGVWLHGSVLTPIVSAYSKILLIGNGISAAGYISYAIIIARGDYKFQAQTSMLATIVVLIATTFSAYLKNIELVCYSYVLYFSLVTGAFFYRTAIRKM